MQKPRSAVIIDDEPDIRTYLGTLLADAGWQVREAPDVAAGLKLLREEPPAAVLLDLMMPDRGGLNALVEIRKDPALAATPVLIVSGIQEKLTAEIAEAINDILQPQGVGVMIESEHSCMTMRGVNTPGSNLVTSRLMGVLRDDARTREEFLRLARGD